MVKLSEQILAEQQQEQQRPTRTQRVLAQQEEVRKAREFKDLKGKAEELRRTEFANVQSVEEYEQKYNRLSPELKSFFATPQELRVERQQRIEVSLTKIRDRVSYAEQRLRESEESYSKGIEYSRNRKWRDSEDQEEYEDKLEDKYEERQAYWKNYKKGLEEGLGKLSAGKDISFADANDYADSLGSYYQEKEESRNAGRRASEEAFSKILKESPIADVFIEFQQKYKSQIDWTDPKNVALVIKSTEGVMQPTAEQQYREASKQDILYLDYTEKEIELPYVQRGTISDDKKTELFPITIDKPATEGIISKTMKTILSKTGEIPLISTFIGAGGTMLTVREVTDPLKAKVSETTEKLLLGEMTRTGLKEELDVKFQEEYEAKFYRSDIGKKSFYGEIEFEKAIEQFGESEEAKIISKKYQLAIISGRAGKFTKEGFAIAGLGLAGLGLKLIPETYGELAVTSALVYTGAKILTTIPPVVVNVATAGFGVVGVTQAVSPILSPEEKAGGVITATLSAGILGVQAFRFLRQPTIRTEQIVLKQAIDPKLQRGFVSKQYTKVIKDVYGKTTVIEKYKANKLINQIISGRRTIVSTKWRDILKIDPIYKGIPYQQKGTKFVIEGFRGSYIYQTPSAYQKSLKLLIKRAGLTERQARATLKYYQPKQIISDYTADIMVKYGDYFKKPIIKIVGTRDITQPVSVIDEGLGIKTRGATSIREIIKGKGTIIGDVKGRTLYATTFDIEKTYLTGAGKVYQKLTQAGKTTKQFHQVTSVAEKGDEFLRLQIDRKGFAMAKDFPYKVFDEKILARQFIPRGKMVYGETESAIFKKTVPRVEIDLRKIYGYSVKEEILRKQKISDISKLRDPDYIKDVFKTLKDIYGDKPIKKLGIIPKKVITPTSIGGSAIQEIKQITKIKSALSPIQSIKTQIKNVLKIGERSGTLAGLGLGSIAITKGATDLKTSISPATDLRTIIRDITKEAESLESAQASLSAQATAQKQIQQLEQGYSGVRLPPSQITKLSVFDFRPPTVPSLPIFFPTGEGKKKKRKKGRSVVDLAYLPDFTSRILGLKQQTLTEKQAIRKVKQILTGLEIRRPVKVKF